MKPTCVIVDIDGTLAKMRGRGPFEWDRVGEDRVNWPIARLVGMYHQNNYKVIIFSGRDEICRPETVTWLQQANICYTDLFMRPRGNNEKDSVVKRRLFDENVAQNYIVELVIDDRNQVVDMWRKDLGLTCLQVDYGDF